MYTWKLKIYINQTDTMPWILPHVLDNLFLFDCFSVQQQQHNERTPLIRDTDRASLSGEENVYYSPIDTPEGRVVFYFKMK